MNRKIDVFYYLSSGVFILMAMIFPYSIRKDDNLLVFITIQVVLLLTAYVLASLISKKGDVDDFTD